MNDTATRAVPTRLYAALALAPAEAEWRREPYASLSAAEARLDELEGGAAEMRLVVLGPREFVIEWR